MERYNPKYIEKKWQKFWEENPDLYSAKSDEKAEKKYILDMFPYPSSEGLHTGHVESYTATDIVSRYLRMKGKNVMHPQGWDAFGLPAENFAIKTKVHPKKTTAGAIKNFKKQMGMMGLSYDWSREVNSSNPDYYKWTQWFFLLLYKNGLAYKKKAKVNWCEHCQTVLANEQAEGGICERCKNPVIQKDLEQWFFKITDFIEDKSSTSGLISGLDKIDWPESTKLLQKNWIGKSLGAIIKFKVKNTRLDLEVFTTRLDTIYGCTYCVIAPENELLNKFKDKIENWDKVAEYIGQSKKKSDLTRMEAKDKTGVEIKGVKVINPFTKEELPLFVADYVLAQYGTGSVMAVPAHDERDFEFAKKYDLPIKESITPASDAAKSVAVYTDDGKLVNSGEYSRLASDEAREKMTIWLEKNNLGGKKINYKLRDWLVSRQRYWGAPIPIIYCEKCGEVPVPEEDLPVELPDDVDFLPTGESPLVKSKKFHDIKCPKCHCGKARRESDTMDTFVCSSWYYLRYADPKNDKEFASKELLCKWLPVDLYVGGAEHSVLHLLYSRFFTKVLHFLGYINFDEPFDKLRHQGIILAEDGRKMSKSLGNVVNPDKVVEKWGADSLRLFEMFMGPLEDAKPWNTQGIVGIYRFLEKVWKMKTKIKPDGKKLEILTNRTIKKVSEDIDELKFNTAISSLMILANGLEKQGEISSDDYSLFLKLLSPFAPHITEELWNQSGNNDSIFREKWPEYDPKFIQDEEIEIVIQVNGKVRDKIAMPADISEEEAKKLAVGSKKIKNYIGDKKINKIIFVKGRLINIVI